MKMKIFLIENQEIDNYTNTKYRILQNQKLRDVTIRIAALQTIEKISKMKTFVYEGTIEIFSV